MTLQSVGFTFFAKITKGSCVFCCSSFITFNPTSHLKNENLAKVFSGEFCEIFEKTFFYRTPLVPASVGSNSSLRSVLRA